MIDRTALKEAALVDMHSQELFDHPIIHSDAQILLLTAASGSRGSWCSSCSHILPTLA
jgi:hypothetical protein